MPYKRRSILFFFSMLYQSPLWRYINKIIFKKPVFDVTINSSTYQVIIKQKQIFGRKINWYQILGVDIHKIPTDPNVLRAIICPQLPYKNWNILIQIWWVDIVHSDHTKNIKKYTPKEIAIFEDKLKTHERKLIKYWWRYSIKQNLPQANIIIDTTQDVKKLWADISSNTKNHINKAEKKWVTFDRVKNQDDLSYFKQLYIWVGNYKWFWVVADDLIDDLYVYLSENNLGDIFLVRYEDKIVGGALCLFDDQDMIYLYGGNDTTIWNIWASQYLHRNIIKYAHDKWFKNYDMLWASRIWKKDRLSNVTQFKAGFGGTKYEYLGSFDIVLSPILYRIYQWIW